MGEREKGEACTTPPFPKCTFLRAMPALFRPPAEWCFEACLLPAFLDESRENDSPPRAPTVNQQITVDPCTGSVAAYPPNERGDDTDGHRMTLLVGDKSNDDAQLVGRT